MQKEDTTWEILRGVAAERPADVEELAKSALLDRVYDMVAARREEMARTVFRGEQPEPEVEPQPEPEVNEPGPGA